MPIKLGDYVELKSPTLTQATLGVEAKILFCTQKRLQRKTRPEARGKRPNKIQNVVLGQP